jgi:hypothetical protein
VHNLNFDKLEIHTKTEFLTQYPYEVPCQSLFSALLHYQEIAHQINGVVKAEIFDMKTFQLVHLKNIKGGAFNDEFDMDLDVGESCTSLCPIEDQDFGFRKA